VQGVEPLQGLGFTVLLDKVFRIQALGFRAELERFRTEGLWLRIYDLGFRVESSGLLFRVQRFSFVV